MKTNILSNMNSFAKRAMMVIAVVMMASSAWGRMGSPYTCTFTTWMTESSNQVTVGDITWTISRTTGKGSPTTTFGNQNSQTAMKFGAGSSNYYSSISLSTSDFSTYNITKVVLYISANTNSTKSITVTQGATTIGTQSQSFSGSNWVTNSTYNTNSGSGGNLTIAISSDATATFIHSIEVTYSGGSKYTVTFSAEGGTCATSTLTEGSVDGGVLLPSASPSAACSSEGWTFAGWKRTSAQTETTSIPTLYAAGTQYYPRSSETLYAVYKLGDVYSIDFESASSAYTAWTFTKMTSQQSASIPTHSGDYYGTTGGNGTASIATNSTVSPKRIRYYVSKQTTNITTSSWQVQTKTAEGSWTNRGDAEDATSMAVGEWVEVEVDLSSYSDVYVQISYSGSTAVRNIDDVTLSCATYNSNPSCCDKLVELSKGTQTNATISSISPSTVATCSSTAADRNVTITVAAATGYEFTSSARLTYSGDGTATYQSGPTGSGPYTFVYQFAKNDNGDGTFSVTSATPQTYTITYKDQGDEDFTGTQAGAPTTHTYGTATTLKIPTKYGHTFGGWFTAADCASGAVGTSSSATLGATDYTANITLYAKWTEKSLTNYRTSCCTDPELSFLDENGDPTTTYTIVREDLASASAAVEIDCDFGSLNTSSEFTWYSTSRAAKTFPETGATSRTTPSSQLSYMTIDMSNKTITASQTGIYTITIKQAGATISETVYCDAEAEVVVTVKTVDKFIDAVNGNFSGEAQRLEDVGGGILLPTEATFSINDACHLTTRRLLGWIKASDLNSYRTSGRVDYIDDLKTGDPATNKVIAPGTRVEATGVTWYAVWGEEVTP